MRLSSVLAFSLCAAPFAAGLQAQGVSTAAIHGTVRSADGSAVDGAHVSVVNTATGFSIAATVRHGGFYFEGLEPGGPYSVAVSHAGFAPLRRDDIHLQLGEPLSLSFRLHPTALLLDTLHVDAREPDAVHTSGGTATTVSGALLHRLPTLNGNFYELVRLVPQVSTRIGFAPGGMSGGGVGFRFNGFLTNGVPERSLLGNQPPEFGGGKSLPFAAVAEYQVLLSPFDVRYGDFAGALVNAVTRSGDNRLRGSAFGFARDQAMARGGGGAATTPYQRLLYGASAGGPIRRDRMHFFVAAELQRLTARAPGPYLGQPETATPPVPVADSTLSRVDAIMQQHGLVAGSGGAVENSNPRGSVFGRIDVALPEWNSRATVWVNANRSENQAFGRPPRQTFPLSTHVTTQLLGVRTIALSLHSWLPRLGGGHNELLLSHRKNWTDWVPAVRQPIVGVAVPSTTGGAVTLLAGTPLEAQGSLFRSWGVNLRDNLTFALGSSHVVTLGAEAEWFRVEGQSSLNAYGTWTFSSLDSLAQGMPARYEVERDFGSSAVPLSGAQYAVYAGDRVRVGERVSLTFGLRADLLAVHGRAPYNPLVDSLFGRRTDEMPERRIHLSPRIGFTWNVDHTGRDQLRGGVGIFTGRPPLAWLHSALYRYGVGTGVLRCGPTTADLGAPPPFEPDYRTPPAACAGQTGSAVPPVGDVDLLDRRLRMAQTLRGTLAWERRLPGGMRGTLEALFTRNISDFVFVNLNLAEPAGSDRNGRAMYGTLAADGAATPRLRADTFPSVIDLRNSSRNRAYQLSAGLEKRFAAGVALTSSYTYSRVRDAQTPLRVVAPGSLNWSTGRAVAGRHDDPQPGISLNDVPHRVVLAGTWGSTKRRWATEVALYYVGEAGSPFTYVAYGTGPRGDLNADGSRVNDPVYIPRNASDTGEILFAGAAERVSAQQAAFERFIERKECLRRQRGRIVERNSCREPWSHHSIASLRQTIPLATRRLEVELDLFNVLNLLNRHWGIRRLAAPAILEHVGQAMPASGESQSIFRFDETTAGWVALPAESAFQFQVGVHYRF